MGISITGGVKVPQGKFSVGLAPAAGFTANAVNFDGTNDWLTRGGALTGAVDNVNLLLSIWFNVTGGDGTFLRWFLGAGGPILLSRDNTNEIFFRIESPPGPVSLWQFTSDALFSTTSNPGWHHLLIAAELDVTPVGQIYLDDTPLAITEITVPTAGDVDWTDTDWSVGGTLVGNTLHKGDFSEFYLTNEYLDISVEANRRKFIDAAGKPVDLGSDGSTPTDITPLVFFSGETVDWHTNKGSGGGFTENGALTTASTSPTD